ncbi:hypothetical protein MUK42_03227 [Musa troglodytarum]|uniref:Uncharacterized protein n=1 Tax=Musa troglodytarum TaxID=320322 RepID=A0A9E7H1W2_9LILI|nr:hypothetical protein MUK42_03227 [Musa troglodytarum]
MREAIGGEGVPPVGDGDDAGAVFGDLEEDGHGEVEVGAGRVAPPAVVGGESVVGRAEVGGGDEDGGAPAVTPTEVVRALDLEAGPAALPLVKQRRAQSCRLHPVPLAVQIPIPTRPAYASIRHQIKISSASPEAKSKRLAKNWANAAYPWCRTRRCRRRRWHGHSATDHPCRSRECALAPAKEGPEGLRKRQGRPTPLLARSVLHFHSQGLGDGVMGEGSGGIYGLEARECERDQIMAVGVINAVLRK